MNPPNESILPNFPLKSALSSTSGKKNESKTTSKSKTSVHLETLKIPRASEVVADKLRTLIVQGTVGAGASLPSEKELVAQLGVSRATLREALRMLETEGLITTKTGPKGGIVVQRPGTANLTRSLDLLLQLEATPFTALLEARRLLEPLCANLAAERITDEDVANLQNNLELMRRSLDDMQEYLKYQLKFHLGIFAAAHNDVLRLYTTSIGELITAHVAKVGLTESERRIGVKAAESILAALIAKNGTLAARRAEAHLKAFDAVLQAAEIGTEGKIRPKP